MPGAVRSVRTGAGGAVPCQARPCCPLWPPCLLLHVSPLPLPCLPCPGHQLPLSNPSLRGGPRRRRGAAGGAGCPAGAPEDRKVGGAGGGGSSEPQGRLAVPPPRPPHASVLQGEAAAEVPAELPHHRAGQDHGHVPRGAPLRQDAGAEQTTRLPALRHHPCGCHDGPGAVRGAGQVGLGGLPSRGVVTGVWVASCQLRASLSRQRSVPVPSLQSSAFAELPGQSRRRRSVV